MAVWDFHVSRACMIGIKIGQMVDKYCLDDTTAVDCYWQGGQAHPLVY